MAPPIPSVTLNNGLKMPIFGLGTWKSKPGEVNQIVKDAIDAGYKHFDGAHFYQNEHEVGAAINSKIRERVVERQDLFVVSKLWSTHHRPDLVVSALKQTLEELQLDYLDLYLIHFPMGLKEGSDLLPKDADGQLIPSDVDYLQTWKAMEKCVTLGLTKSIGISNFNAAQMTRLLESCSIKPVVNQVECHPYLNQRKLQEFCEASFVKQVYLTGYSPLGSADRPWALPSDPKLLEDPKIVKLGQKYGKSPAQIVLRWMVQRDIIVIPKTVTKSRLVENMSIFDFKLEEEDMDILFKMDCKGRCLAMDNAKGHKYYPFNDEF